MAKGLRIPLSSKCLSEARLYASDSVTHTMNYPGFKDKDGVKIDRKLERITVGKFGQCWVAELCKINGIPVEEDSTSPLEPDDCDLVIHGYKIDVKTTSAGRSFLGQVSPGIIDDKTGKLREGKDYDYFCLLMTDKLCSWIEPCGFISVDDYLSNSVKVSQGEEIPGTTIRQRFGYSYFLKPETPMIPFYNFLFKNKEEQVKKYVYEPYSIIEEKQINQIEGRISTLTTVMMEMVKAQATGRKSGNVIPMPSNGDLFKSFNEAG